MTDQPSNEHGRLDATVATATVFAELGSTLLRADSPAQALQRLTETTATVIRGAAWVSVTRGLSDRFTTVAASDPVATRADELQYRLGTGPCVDAVINDAVFTSPDLALDDRWSQFGPQVARDHGVRSVLSLRLRVDGADDDLNAALNLYGSRVEAFDDDDRYLATLLAAHAAVAVAAVYHRSTADNLQRALESNRDIGTAMGVLMARHQVTRAQAFDLLRVASQNMNRKVSDLAVEVADTGALELPRRTSPRSHGHG